MVLTLAVALIASACGGSAEPDTQPGRNSVETRVESTTTVGTVTGDDTFSLVGLPAGTHVGVAAFSPPSAGLADEWERLWGEANEAATVGRLQLDWVDIEPTQGSYDLTELDEGLRSVSAGGRAPMVTIAAVDVSGTDIPAWLGEFEPKTAATAYNAMLDAVAPRLTEHGVWLLAIANEPPFDDGLDPAAFGAFVDLVVEHGHDVLPDTAMTFTFAGGHLRSDDPDIRALVDLVDVVSVNHYCLNQHLTVIDLADTKGDIDEVVELAGGRPIVFQEFGCPSGEALSSSEEFQAAWFSRAFEVIKAEEQIRAAFVFEFSDWSEELVDADYKDAIDAEPELADFFDRFRSWLMTGGLVRSDMTTRPAWDVYLANLGG